MGSDDFDSDSDPYSDAEPSFSLCPSEPALLSSNFPTVLGNESVDLSKDNTVKPLDLTELMDMDDGPLFRLTLKHLEARTASLKQNLKKIIKIIRNKLDAEMSVSEADKELLIVMGKITSIGPATQYMNTSSKLINDAKENFIQHIESLILNPLEEIYEEDVKSYDRRKKKFDQESDAYYAFLSKYLSVKQKFSISGKKHVVSDEDFTTKKREFDLRRFDYLSYMQDLHISKDQQILYYYTLFLEKRAQFYSNCTDIVVNLNPQLVMLADRVAMNAKILECAMQQRSEKRKQLAATNPTESDQQSTLGDGYLDAASRGSVSKTGGTSVSSQDNSPAEPSAAITGSSSTTQNHHLLLPSQRSKEGFLYGGKYTKDKATRWKQYWCVLSKGQLREFSKWESKSLKMKNIVELQLCTVKVARDVDRRFCFEIISPNLHRIYQATSAEEQATWIRCIQQSISAVLQGTLEHGTDKDGDINEDFPKLPDHEILTPWLASMQLASVATNSSTTASAHQVMKSVEGALDLPDSRQSNQADSYNFLLELYKADEMNCYCADCGAADPEWCSINMGLLLCIECSGIHRSLGCHVSKIRSFLLDDACFTPELKDLFFTTGNRAGAEIWESRLGSMSNSYTKPKPSDNRNIKTKFIYAKYVEKLFVHV